jgi:hypothetical protein
MANTFLRKTQRAVGTSLTAIESYTVGASTQTTLIGLSVANITASNVVVDVTLNDGTNDTYIVKSATVLPGGTLVAVGGDQKVVLQTGDSIKVKSDTASSVDCIMSLLEIT